MQDSANQSGIKILPFCGMKRKDQEMHKSLTIK